MGRLIELDHGGRWQAFTAVGAPLGVFASSANAARAVYEAATDQHPEVAA